MYKNRTRFLTGFEAASDGIYFSAGKCISFWYFLAPFLVWKFNKFRNDFIWKSIFKILRAVIISQSWMLNSKLNTIFSQNNRSFS